MRIDTPTQYLQTIDEFIGHWQDVNVELAPGSLVMPPSYDLAQLQADRDQLAATMTEIVQATNILEGHRTGRDLLRTSLRERMRQLQGFIEGMLAESVYVGQLPKLVQMNEGTGGWIERVEDFEHLWSQINDSPPVGFTPPMTLTGGYAIADFSSDVLSLKSTFSAITIAQQDQDRHRDSRRRQYTAIRQHLVRYRQAVGGLFPADHPLVTSLPRISPKRVRRVVEDER